MTLIDNSFPNSENLELFFLSKESDMLLEMLLHDNNQT